MRIDIGSVKKHRFRERRRIVIVLIGAVVGSSVTVLAVMLMRPGGAGRMGGTLDKHGENSPERNHLTEKNQKGHRKLDKHKENNTKRKHDQAKQSGVRMAKATAQTNNAAQHTHERLEDMKNDYPSFE